MFDGVVALVACDKTIPARPWPCCAPMSPEWCSTAAPSCRQAQGRDISIGDVFEAVGANARAASRTPNCSILRTMPAPARRLRRPVHRQHHGYGDELIGLARWHGCGAAGDKRKDDVATAAAKIIMDAVRNICARATSARARRSTTPSPAWRPRVARPTRCCTCWLWAREAEVPAFHRRFRRHLRLYP